MPKKPKRNNENRQSKIVKDEESWSPSRSWALGLLIALEIANLIYGPAFWYQLALQYKAKGWTEAARFMCRMSYIANPTNRTGQMAEAFSRVCLPKNNIPEEAQQKNIEGYNFDMFGESRKRGTPITRSSRNIPISSGLTTT